MGRRRSIVGSSRLEHLLVTVLGTQPQGGSRFLRFENDVSVLCAGGPGKAQSRVRLGCPDLDGRTATLRDEAKKHSLRRLRAALSRSRRKNDDAGPHATLCVDNLECATSQHRQLALREGWTHLLRDSKEQKCEVRDGERNESPLGVHGTPPWFGY